MIRNLALTLGLVVMAAGRSEAANIAAIVAPPNLFNIVILVVAVFCVIASVKVLMLVRGGQLARPVQIFAGAFAALVFCQLLTLLRVTEVVVVPAFVPPLMLAATAGLFLYGLLHVRRVLS